MEIQTEKENDILFITIYGEVDASSCIDLDNALEEAIRNNEKNILIDCSNLEYISSAGLGVFMSHIKEVEEKGIIMLLFNMSEKVRKVFQILGLDELIRIVQTKEEAKELAQ